MFVIFIILGSVFIFSLYTCISTYRVLKTKILFSCIDIFFPSHTIMFLRCVRVTARSSDLLVESSASCTTNDYSTARSSPSPLRLFRCLQLFISADIVAVDGACLACMHAQGVLRAGGRVRKSVLRVAHSIWKNEIGLSQGSAGSRGKVVCVRALVHVGPTLRCQVSVQHSGTVGKPQPPGSYRSRVVPCEACTFSVLLNTVKLLSEVAGQIYPYFSNDHLYY